MNNYNKTQIVSFIKEISNYHLLEAKKVSEFNLMNLFNGSNASLNEFLDIQFLWKQRINRILLEAVYLTDLDHEDILSKVDQFENMFQGYLETLIRDRFESEESRQEKREKQEQVEAKAAAIKAELDWKDYC